MSATLIVPADHAGLFQREATFTLEAAADQLHEALRWAREGRADPGRIERERGKLRDAERLLVTAEGQPGELRFDAGGHALGNTLEGCVLKAGEQVGEACEAPRSASQRTDVRLAIAELELWLDLLDAVDGGRD